MQVGVARSLWTEGGKRYAAAWLAAGLLVWVGCGREGESPAGSQSAASDEAPAQAVGLDLGAPLAPDATLEQALAHRDPLQRVQRVGEILAAATPNQLDAIQHAIESAPLAWGDIEYALFASWWARFDPSAALAYCELELRLDHPRVVSEVLRMWGRSDPQAAIDSGWLAGRSLDAQGLHSEYVDPLVVGWFESGKPGLENWIHGLDPSSKTTALGAYMRMKILRDGRRPALEWTRTAPFAPDLQRLLLAIGLKVVARQEPDLAIEWLDIAAKDGIDVRSFVARIARGWANRDPRGALEWLMTREVDVAERWRAVHDVVRQWLDRDEKAVDEWVLAHSEEPWVDVIRQQAITHHVKTRNYHVDWLALMERSSHFLLPEQKKLQYLWVIQRWKVIDPEAAAQWLAENAELLGEQIQYVEQLPMAERERIEAARAEERPEADG